MGENFYKNAFNTTMIFAIGMVVGVILAVNGTVGMHDEAVKAKAWVYKGVLYRVIPDTGEVGR